MSFMVFLTADAAGDLEELYQYIVRHREIFFKPYRVIYRVMRDAVYVLLIVDGRREMQALLQRRLLGK